MSRVYQKIKSHLKAAKVYAELSYSARLKVGAVITRDDRIISIGYNGTPTGFDNECEIRLDDSVKVTRPEVVHAEANAILFSAKRGLSTDGSILITTHSPCYDCAKMIVQCGIVEVYYEVNYRDKEPLVFLKKCGVLVKKIGELND